MNYKNLKKKQNRISLFFIKKKALNLISCIKSKKMKNQHATIEGRKLKSFLSDREKKTSI